ncbi:MAG: NUDIX hydrolase [Bacteroidota bacterium]
MEEQVVIVNAENEVINVVPRSEMRAHSLLHRSTYIIIFNSKGELLIQKRSEKKDLYPGYFDPTTGGVVQENESYERNAARELEEELGIKEVKLNFEFDFHFEDGQCKVWGRVFSCIYDGLIEPKDGEVVDFFFLDPKSLDQFFQDHLVMPDGRHAIEQYLLNLSNN